MKVIRLIGEMKNLEKIQVNRFERERERNQSTNLVEDHRRNSREEVVVVEEQEEVVGEVEVVEME